jgi:hypothetical protein
MRRTWLAALALLLAGCGVQPSGVDDVGQAPTGVAAGVTLYFVDADGRLQPQLRETDHLGTIAEAMALLLSGPGAGLRTQIEQTEVTQVFVDTTPDPPAGAAGRLRGDSAGHRPDRVHGVGGVGAERRFEDHQGGREPHVGER